MGLLAHQGGWDELLLVSAPIVVIGGFILLVQRRAAASEAARQVGEGRTSSIDAPSDANRPTKSS